jgi:hypothetical protein
VWTGFCMLVMTMVSIGGMRPWEMVDNSTSPLQTQFGPVFGDEAVQSSLLFQRRDPIRFLLLAPSSTSPRQNTSLISGFGASQAEIGGNGQESTSRAVHRRRCGSQRLRKKHSCKACACSPARDRKARDGGLTVAEDTFGRGSIQPFGECEIRTTAIW